VVGGAQVTSSASQSNQTFPHNLPEKEMPYESADLYLQLFQTLE